MRTCSRKGCGVDLLKPDGVTADYSTKRFCSRECKLADLRDKMRELRKNQHRAHIPGTTSAAVRRKAGTALHKAVATGLLIRPAECSRCHKVGPVEGHHHRGYSDPLPSRRSPHLMLFAETKP